MEDSKKEFKSIAKSTTILGTVQIINILITIFRTKVLAYYTGPTGVGINSLYTESINLLKSFTGLGLSTSGVRSVSISASSNDSINLAKTVKALRFWVWITGSVGLCIGIAFSRYFSELTFKSTENTVSYVILSFTVLLSQLNAGQLVLLQGTRKIVWLSAANLLGSFFGSLLAIPFYYFFKEDGIVAAILITSIVSIFFSWYYSRKVNIEKVDLTKNEFVSKGKELLVLGFFVNLSTLFTVLSSFLLRNVINHYSGLVVVGLFNAGFSIVSTYTGLVFNAMKTDFYPRLTAAINNNDKINESINSQAEFSLYVLGPILLFFLVFINPIIRLLYSNEFTGIETMIQWIALGILFKSLSWTLAYVILAKGDTRIFLINEVLTNIYFFIFNFIGFRIGGLDGLGVSFLVCYFVYLLQLVLFCRSYYKVKFYKNILKLLMLYGFVLIIYILIANVFSYHISLVLGLILICFVSFISANKLNQRLDLITFIKRRIFKK